MDLYLLWCTANLVDNSTEAYRSRTISHSFAEPVARTQIQSGIYLTFISSTQPRSRSAHSTQHTDTWTQVECVKGSRPKIKRIVCTNVSVCVCVPSVCDIREYYKNGYINRSSSAHVKRSSPFVLPSARLVKSANKTRNECTPTIIGWMNFVKCARCTQGWLSSMYRVTSIRAMCRRQWMTMALLWRHLQWGAKRHRNGI